MSASKETTIKNGWRNREFWRDGDLVGWIGGCFDPITLRETGYYGQGGTPLRFLVKNVSRDEAVAAVEEAARAKRPIG